MSTTPQNSCRPSPLHLAGTCAEPGRCWFTGVRTRRKGDAPKTLLQTPRAGRHRPHPSHLLPRSRCRLAQRTRPASLPRMAASTARQSPSPQQFRELPRAPHSPCTPDCSGLWASRALPLQTEKERRHARKARIAGRQCGRAVTRTPSPLPSPGSPGGGGRHHKRTPMPARGFARPSPAHSNSAAAPS